MKDRLNVNNAAGNGSVLLKEGPKEDLETLLSDLEIGMLF